MLSRRFSHKAIYGNAQRQPIRVEESVPAYSSYRPFRKYLNSNGKRQIGIKSDFYDEEYINEQRRALINEISKLRDEIRPLMIQLGSIESNNRRGKSAPASVRVKDEISKYHWISSRLSELHAEYESCSVELGKVRRIFTEQTENRLASDIKYQRTLLNSLLSELHNQEFDLASQEGALSHLMNVQRTNQFNAQIHQIEDLKKELSNLKESEEEMTNRYLNMVNNISAMIEFDKTVSDKKQRIQSLQYKRVESTVKLRKIAKKHHEEIAAIENQILAKQQKSKQRNETSILRKLPNLPSSRRKPPETAPSRVPPKPPNRPISSPRVRFSIDSNQMKLSQNDKKKTSLASIVSKDPAGDTFFVDTVKEISDSLLIPKTKQ